MLTTITGDGDHYLDIEGTSNVVNANSSTVRVVGSPGGATVLVGEELSGSYDGFDDNDISLKGGVFEHGHGARVMVRVSGYTTDVVVSHKVG